MVVFEKGTPFGKAQVGGDEGGLFLVSLVHQSEEEADLNRLDLDIANLVDLQTIEGEVFLKDLVFGVIGHRAVELGDEVGKEHVATAMALVDGVDEKAGGQAGLAAAGGAQPEQVLALVHVAQGVVEGHDFLFVELGLPLEGKGLDDQRVGNTGAFEPELTSVLAFDAAFFFQHVGEQPRVREASFGGQLEILIPMDQKSAQAQILQGFDEFFIHDGGSGGSW